MTERKPLSIIVLSFQDPRVVEAVDSVRRFDDVDAVRLIIIDGGSKKDIVDSIRPYLRDDDLLISERDKGIFDGLNKGLDLCVSPYIGWLGSDDIFSGQVLASDVIRELDKSDILVANQVLFRGSRVRRLTHSWPSKYRLARYGLHNPHFSTFGRASLLQGERFDLHLRGSDIAYFLAIFSKRPRVATTSAVAVLQGEGGFSTRSYGKSLNTNLELLPVYAKYTNGALAPIAVMIKLSYKFVSSLYYNLFRRDVSGYKTRRVQS